MTQNVLTLLAHPSSTSFTGALAKEFSAGAFEAGASTRSFNLFETTNLEDLRFMIKTADHLALFYPLWCEMPPAKLVDFIQRTFVEGFAFHYDGGKRIVDLKLPVSVVISMGQEKPHHCEYLTEALQYVGLTPQRIFLVQGVGPTLPAEKAKIYLEQAFKHGAAVAQSKGE
jgi:putative NADPH-quinone reductase